MTAERTHFGYEDVSPEEKTRRVRGVFDSVAGKYDLMNDLMSGGLHRLWKRFAVDLVSLRAGQKVRLIDAPAGNAAPTASPAAPAAAAAPAVKEGAKP